MSARDRVKELLSDGKSKEEIYAKLLSENFSIAQIESGFDTPQKDLEKDHNPNTANTILTIAALLVGIGIFSFVASNWQELTKSIKVVIILSAMLASYWYGYYFYTRKNMKKVGAALYLLGNLIYGAGIFLIGQMFNIRASWPDGIILWMLGVFSVSYATGLLTLYRLGVVLGFVSVVVYPLYKNIDLWNTGRTFLFTSTLLLFVASIVSFYLGYDLLNKKK